MRLLRRLLEAGGGAPLEGRSERVTTGGRGERPQKPRWEERLLQDRGAKIALLCLWAGVLLLCFCSRERFTVDGVLSYTPESPALAALFLLLLFASSTWPAASSSPSP